MKIVIDFEENTSAFEETSMEFFESSEYGYIMKQVGKFVNQCIESRGTIKSKVDRNLKDTNGNTVGKVSVKIWLLKLELFIMV